MSPITAWTGNGKRFWFKLKVLVSQKSIAVNQQAYCRNIKQNQKIKMVLKYMLIKLWQNSISFMSMINEVTEVKIKQAHNIFDYMPAVEIPFPVRRAVMCLSELLFCV